MNQAAFLALVARLLGGLEPTIKARLLATIASLKDSVSQRDVIRLILSGDLQRIPEAVVPDAAFRPVQDATRRGILIGVGRHGTTVTGARMPFDPASPLLTGAIREQELAMFPELTETMRAAVRVRLEDALRRGVGPAQIAREIRDVIGLAENQAAAVLNFERMLRDGSSEVLTRTLRDHRYDAMIRRGGLSEDQIQMLVGRYHERMLNHQATTIARTLALGANRTAQRVVWEQAIEDGRVDPERMTKRWIGKDDGRERPEHLEMNDTVIPYRELFHVEHDGEVFWPGDNAYNCRCLAWIRPG